jgi:hypothetical protein
MSTKNRASSVLVSKMKKLGSRVVEEGEDEQREVHVFQSEPSSVSIAKGLTVNLGNYESARVDVKIIMPCYPEEWKEVYDLVDNAVDERLVAEQEALRALKG